MHTAESLLDRLFWRTKIAFVQEIFLKRIDSVCKNDAHGYKVDFQNDSLRVLAALETTSGSNAIDAPICSNALALYQNN